MVGRRGRFAKRKMEELQEDHSEGKFRSTKEARIEAISLDGSEPVHIGLMTLHPDTWMHHESSDEWNDENCSRISEAEEGREGTLSQGICWRGIPDPPHTQVALSCKRNPNGEMFDCETQTCHFTPVLASKVVVVPDSNTPETIKVEIDTDQQEEFLSHPLLCCVDGCGTQFETNTTTTFYTVPKGREKSVWTEMFNILPCSESDTRQHVCSKHFITPTKLLNIKGKTRKKKTCDMLVAEEAEKIRQGLTAGRPKRTPKPNKNYDWAAIVPLIKSEPDGRDEDLYLNSTGTSDIGGGGTLDPRKHLLITLKEDKENKKPISDAEGDDEEEEEEDLENISLPSHPRPPPPKPKGRPHRIRDSCAQTEWAYERPVTRQPLREVKVQCSINSEPSTPCTTCSYINWLRLEELLVECSTQIGDLCALEVQECIRKVVKNVPHPTHATNILKLLSGEERDALENTSNIVLAPDQEDEVEIENVIHATVEEPMTGVREITPRTWQKKAKWKKSPVKVNLMSKEEDEEDLDGLGIKEATEMDDDEFNPVYPEEEESEEDYQGLDDEDWTINKQDKDSKSATKKKPKKTQQQPKVKKEQMVLAREGARASEGTTTKSEDGSISKVPDTSQGRRRRKEGDTRWIRKSLTCSDCNLTFTTQKKFDHHFNHVHLGIAPWYGEHTCEDCGRVFSQKITLNVHRIFKHGAPRRYHCPQCVYEAPTKEYLKRHMKVHTNEKRHVCPHCHKGLKTAESFRNHMVIHTNKGRFICQVCQKAYNHKGAYQDHIRTHCEYRDYACDYCGAAFKAYKHVVRHIRAVHLNDKRFICDVCGAQHMTGFNLKTHVKKHGDLSNVSYAYHCTICKAKFRGPEGMSVHMKVFHSTPSTSLNPKDPEGSISEPKGDKEGRLLSPHPTRRPVKFRYSKLIKEGRIAGNYNEESDSWGTIYVDNSVDFSPFDGKEDEAVVYEVYSGAEEEELENQEMQRGELHPAQEAATSTANSKDRVIHVYPCSDCHIMFTSRGGLEQHYEICQQNQFGIKEEPANIQ